MKMGLYIVDPMGNLSSSNPSSLQFLEEGRTISKS